MTVSEAVQGKAIVGLYFSAHYCKHCVEFTPTLVAAYEKMKELEFQVVFISNDRTAEAYDSYFAGMPWLAVPFDEVQSLKVQLRERFAIKTIPALILLDTATGEIVTTTGYQHVAADPTAKGFPWREPKLETTVIHSDVFGERIAHHVALGVPLHAEKPKHTLTLSERFFTHPIYARGHRGVGLHEEEYYVDENAVRCRAGILNTISMFIVYSSFSRDCWGSVDINYVLIPIVSWDMLAASLLGLTPFAPTGVLATVLACIFQPFPHWKPQAPKRFAWLLGFFVTLTCLIATIFKVTWLGRTAALICVTLTWLECALGWCMGCAIYNYILVRVGAVKECEECKM